MDEANEQSSDRFGYWCASNCCFGVAVHIDLHVTQKMIRVKKPQMSKP